MSGSSSTIRILATRQSPPSSQRAYRLGGGKLSPVASLRGGDHYPIERAEFEPSYRRGQVATARELHHNLGKTDG